MAIQVRSDGADGVTEHSIDDRGLPTRRRDPEIEVKVQHLIHFLRWLQAMDGTDLTEASDDDFDRVARLYLGISE